MTWGEPPDWHYDPETCDRVMAELERLEREFDEEQAREAAAQAALSAAEILNNSFDEGLTDAKPYAIVFLVEIERGSEMKSGEFETMNYKGYEVTIKRVDSRFGQLIMLCDINGEPTTGEPEAFSDMEVLLAQVDATIDFWER